MRNISVANISAADGSVDQIGTAVSGGQLFALSAQAIVTGTVTGTLNIEVCNDPGTPTNWSVVPTIGTVAIASVGVYLIPKFDVAYQWIRAHYVKTSGTGTITVNLCRAGVN